MKNSPFDSLAAIQRILASLHPRILASLNVLTADLACELEGSHRSLALSIQAQI